LAEDRQRSAGTLYKVSGTQKSLRLKPYHSITPSLAPLPTNNTWNQFDTNNSHHSYILLSVKSVIPAVWQYFTEGERTISVKPIVIPIHYRLLWRQRAQRWPAIVSWEIVCRWIHKALNMCHLMNSCGGLSDPMARCVDERELPVEIAIGDLVAKCV
jgi:hypothetical protein